MHMKDTCRINTRAGAHLLCEVQPGNRDHCKGAHNKSKCQKPLEDYKNHTYSDVDAEPLRVIAVTQRFTEMTQDKATFLSNALIHLAHDLDS